MTNNVRFAAFNASLNPSVEGELIADLSTPDNFQAQAVAEIQRNDPDVLLIDESPSNLRVDYVLPSDNLEITDAGVF